MRVSSPTYALRNLKRPLSINTTRDIVNSDVTSFEFVPNFTRDFYERSKHVIGSVDDDVSVGGQ